MRLEQAIVAAVAANSPTFRIYDGVMPQGVTYPAVTFQRISTTKSDTLGEVDTFTRVRVQFDVWGSTVTTVQALAASVRDLFDGHTGSMGGMAVQYARLENENTAFVQDGDRATRRVSMDFVFILHE